LEGCCLTLNQGPKKFVRDKLATIVKKLIRLPKGRQSITLPLQELRAMRISYSQFGEDLVVRSHFSDFDNSVGRFIDVGAFHPFEFSNTMLLSKLGWRGVNIDCDPVKIARFEKLRPHDQNICATVGEAPRDMVYFEYSPEGLTNRIADPGEKNLLSAIGEEPLKVTPIRVTTLTNVIEQSAFRGQHFHYLNVDCEGQDLAVLKGLDFSRYSPDLITVEAWTKAAQAELTAFLGAFGYELTDIVRLTLFFKR
jgi:Methyltransferase FkbM domain